MTRFARFLARTLPHLAVLAMMLVVLAPQASASSWMCEGRVCSSASNVCCCQTPDGAHDQQCPPLLRGSNSANHLSSTEHSQELGACPAACHCSKVVTHDSGKLRPTAAFSPLAPLVFVVTEAVKPVVLAHFVESFVLPIESRGPPPNSIFFASPSLRGPPLA